MCRLVMGGVSSAVIVKDMHRGRWGNYNRYDRMRRYAHRRWREAKDPKRYTYWLNVERAIEHRMDWTR